MPKVTFLLFNHTILLDLSDRFTVERQARIPETRLLL